MKIVTTYVPHPSSNVGVILAKSEGRQKATRVDQSLSTDANHGVAAANLILHMHKVNHLQGSEVKGLAIRAESGTHDSNESGTKHTFVI